jgi:hypothetical protein
MYTLQMSWSFRALVIGMLLSWGLAPQLACLMPDQTMTQSDMDCCKGVSGDCSAANMSHPCCQTVVRTDVGVAAKVVNHAAPRLGIAAATTSVVDLPFSFDRQLSGRTDQAPPDKPSSSNLILRI